MKKRLFTAIPLPQVFLEKFSIYKKRYRQDFLRWLPKPKLHVTICFLGNVQIDFIPPLIETLNEISDQYKSFILEFDKITIAPNNTKPRMIWAQFKKNESYEKLLNQIYGECLKFSDRDEETLHQETIAHITLARSKHYSKLKNLTLQPLELSNLTVNSFYLIESHFSQVGPSYSTLASFDLKEVK